MSKEKVIFFVIDGLGDEEIPEFQNKTPLEAAHTPNMDSWAKEGRTGLLIPVFRGALPTSEEGHFSLFGYNTAEHKLGRGVITAVGAGMEVNQGDVALRGNFATIVNGEVTDRRAGRIKDTTELIEAVNGMEINGVYFNVQNAGEHRVGIVMKGEGLSSDISDSDLHYAEGKKGSKEIKPLLQSKEAEFTAEVLNKFLNKAHEILKEHPVNKKRELPANCILTRGASEMVNFPSFEEKYGKKAACIAGKPLYKQIGRLLGMDVFDVQGATGLPDTNLKSKIESAREAVFSGYDFVFVHIKATDSLAEDGDFQGKKKFIEEIDKNLHILNEFTETLVVTADHSTCSLLANHCPEDIPVLIKGKGKDNTQWFSEKECLNGDIKKIDQRALLPKFVFQD